MTFDCDVSIIVVTYNAEEFILPCLSSVFSNESPLKIEVFVVDNHSMDGTVDLVKKRFPQVRLIVNDANRGFSRANNQAIPVSSGRYIFLLNPDAQVLNDAIPRLVSFMDMQTEIGVLGPRIYNPDLSVQGSARGFPDFTTPFFGRTSILTRIFPHNPISRKNVPYLRPDLNQPQTVDWVSGAAMMIRRDAIMQTGLFSEDYFLFWEDADLCYRMKQAGWSVCYYPDASAIHQVGGSVNQQQARSIIEFHKSAYLWYRKHGIKSSWSPMKIVAGSGLFIKMVFELIHRFVGDSLRGASSKTKFGSKD